MPRVKRKGHMKRNAEAPLSEWSLAELQAEFERLETNPGDMNKWQCFKRKSELGNELYARGDECHA